MGETDQDPVELREVLVTIREALAREVGVEQAGYLMSLVIRELYAEHAPETRVTRPPMGPRDDMLRRHARGRGLLRSAMV